MCPVQLIFLEVAPYSLRGVPISTILIMEAHAALVAAELLFHMIWGLLHNPHEEKWRETLLDPASIDVKNVVQFLLIFGHNQYFYSFNIRHYCTP